MVRFFQTTALILGFMMMVFICAGCTKIQEHHSTAERPDSEMRNVPCSIEMSNHSISGTVTYADGKVGIFQLKDSEKTGFTVKHSDETYTVCCAGLSEEMKNDALLERSPIGRLFEALDGIESCEFSKKEKYWVCRFPGGCECRVRTDSDGDLTEIYVPSWKFTAHFGESGGKESTKQKI